MTWENVSQFLINLFSFDETHPLLFTQFNFWAFFWSLRPYLAV